PFERSAVPRATSASSCPAGRTRRSRPRFSRGAGTPWSAREVASYISVSKVLSAADEPGEFVHGSANERRGCVDEIVTARDRYLASTVSAFALLGRVPGRVQVHMNLVVL